MKVPVVEPVSADVTEIKKEPIPYLREWKSKLGSTVLASFAGFSDNGEVKLVSREHKVISVSSSALSDADQKHLRTLKAQYDAVLRYIRRWKKESQDVDDILLRIADNHLTGE